MALLLAAGGVSAQGTETPPPQPNATLPEVRVGAQAAEPATERASVGRVSDAPIAETPQAIGVIRGTVMRELGVSSLSNAIRTETSAADAYNTIGYIESIQVRGFLLDNALNYTRDGLPISNHAPFAAENKERVEVLKGISGVQNGTSAPGGLVDYVLKRPTATPLRDVFLGVSERGTVLAQGDFGGRLGEANALGYRINLAAENRRPEVRDAPGERGFASGFFDLRLPGNSLLELEFEYAAVRQRSVPGFGLLDTNGDGVADTLPPPIDPRINMNSQPWSQGFESRNAIGSIRFQQALSEQWLYGIRYGQQQIRTNDYLAFPDGCSSGPTYLYPGFCGNYDVDIYDYRSENERRSMRALEAFARGWFVTGAVRHELGLGARQSRYSERYEPMQAYNFVGTSNVFAPVVLPEDPTPSSPNTQRDSRTTEVWLTDVMRFTGGWSLWLGVRQAWLDRSSERTDGSDSVSYSQSFATPWGALGWKPWKGGFAYLSAGSGVESEVVPNRPTVFTNAGQVLPAVRSRQAELGFKQAVEGSGLFSAVLFRIDKPYSEDVAQDDGLATRVGGGREARHRGLELAWAGRPTPALWLQAQATYIDAKTVEAIDDALVGKRTTNVAPLAASLLAVWQLPGVPGLSWANRAFYAGSKAVTADNSIELSPYWQWDTALAWRQRHAGTVTTLRVGVDNVLNSGYWRDAPTQYWGATYLFPAQPRIFRASVQLSF